jgi:hypothetical protein
MRSFEFYEKKNARPLLWLAAAKRQQACGPYHLYYKKCPPGPKLEDTIVYFSLFLKLGNYKIDVTPRAFVHYILAEI